MSYVSRCCKLVGISFPMVGLEKGKSGRQLVSLLSAYGGFVT